MKQVLGTFPPPLRDIKSITYQQEIVKDYDKVIIGKDQVDVLRSKIVWEQGTRHNLNMDINLKKYIIFLRGVEVYIKNDIQEQD